jgi:hypothetical protein
MADEVIPLEEFSGAQLHMSPEGKAFFKHEAITAKPHASLSGPSAHPGSRGGKPVHPDMVPGMGGVAPAAKHAAPRRLSPEEMMALANQMQENMKAQHAAQLSMGPAVKPVEQGVPPWLQDYMAKQPPTNPYAPIPPPNQMTPEQRQMYGAERPAWLQPK